MYNQHEGVCYLFVISLVPEQKLQHIAGQEKTSQLIMLLYSTVKDRDDDYCSMLAVP